MGPIATSSFYNRIITIFQKRYKAKFDDEFPEIVIISLPIPDVVKNPQNEKGVINQLVDAARKLEGLGCDFIAIPCSSVHAYIENLRTSVKIPVLSIIKEVGEVLIKNNISIAGLLSTDLTRRKKLYDRVLADENITLLNMDDKTQISLTRIILDIMNGNKNKLNKINLINIIKNFENQNAKAIILGCTELPLLVERKDCNIMLIDTLNVLAEACVRESIKNYINKN